MTLFVGTFIVLCDKAGNVSRRSTHVLRLQLSTTFKFSLHVVALVAMKVEYIIKHLISRIESVPSVSTCSFLVFGSLQLSTTLKSTCSCTGFSMQVEYIIKHLISMLESVPSVSPCSFLVFW